MPPVPHRRALLLVALLSVLLVGLGTALILSASGPERLGDNGVGPVTPNVNVPGPPCEYFTIVSVGRLLFT